MTRDEIIKANPIHVVAKRYVAEMKQDGAELVGLCPLHKEKTPSFRVNPAKGLFKCFGCNQGGSVIDLVSLAEGISAGDAMKKLSEDRKFPSVQRYQAPQRPAEPEQKAQWKEVCAYDYHDTTGRVVYQVVRYRDEVTGKKTFKQRHVENGKTVWGMNGVERVLYGLPRVMKCGVVWVVEGEKDADTLRSFGFAATSNVGGAGNWLEGYTEALRGKDVIICGDNDEPGEKHVKQVSEALAGKVKVLRIVKVPAPHKDITDYVESIKGDLESKARAAFALADEAIKIRNGIVSPIKTIDELEQEYINEIKSAETSLLNLSNWLPSFRRCVRPLVPGEIVTILADTGVGKTMILQNIAKWSAPVKTLLFELELPGTLTFERFMALVSRETASNVYASYKRGDRFNYESLSHVSVCARSGLTVEQINDLVIKAQLKIGEPVKIVEIDYIQLLKGKGNKSRYEKISDAAEDLKVMAKERGVVVVMTSQVARDKDSEHGTKELGLHDAKDSGAIENSSGLVIGVWKTDPSTMKLKVLKNTKGNSGHIITANVDGEKMLITEKSPIDDKDVPR